MIVMQKRIAVKTRKDIENHFRGALIDEDGREIPITRDMIEDACHALENSRGLIGDLQGRQRLS